MKNNLFKLVTFIFIVSILVGCEREKDVFIEENDNSKEIVESNSTNTGYIKDNIDIKKINESNFEFIYNDEIFKVVYLEDTWKIYDSYKITISSDIKKICQALIDIHPIHGVDMVSYRTADDMAYEWSQHNLVYNLLPAGNVFKSSAKDVDLDPKDQGKSIIEIYEDRTGQTFSLKDLLK